jgi:putative transposase
MAKFRLNDTDYAELLEARKTAKSAREAFRITAILDLHEGMAPAQICATLRIDETTLWRWRSRYYGKGAHGLADDQYNSRNRRLTVEQEANLDEFLSEKLTRDAKTVAAIIKERYGVEYTAAGATALMKRLGYSWHEPHPEPDGASADEQRDSLTETEELRDEVGDKAFYYLDAVHPRPGQDVARGWIKKGRRHVVPTRGKQSGVNAHGALSADGELVWRDEDSVNEDSTIALLETIIAKHPGQRVGACCDRGRYYHHSKAVKAFLVAHSELTLLRLPRSSPNLNKIERLWGLMRRRVLRNTHYENVADFRVAVHGFLNNLDVYKDDVAALLAAPCHIIAN